MIYVDHRRKIYSEPVSKASDPQPPFLNDLTDTLLNGKHPAKFEKVTVENTDGLDVYKVTIDGSNSTSIITYDPSIKMVVRHEFDGGFAFAMRNFNLEVEDSTFRIPAAYRKVAWSAFEQQ